MNIGNLSESASRLLVEVGRMAYGSREGAKGGRGHIGAIRTRDGTIRICKFDTHGGTSRGVEARDSSNTLRTLLMGIANDAHLREEVLADIRRKLGLAPQGDVITATSLLDRKIVAKVVELIGGRKVWSEVKAGYSEANYKSGKDTSFEHVNVSRVSANAKTVADLVRDARGLDTAINCINVILTGFMTRLPQDDRKSAQSFLKKVLTKDFLHEYGGKCVSRDDLEAAARKCLGRILVVKGAVDPYNPGAKDVEKLLGADGWAALAQDRDMLKWCAEHGGRSAGEELAPDPDSLLIDVLRKTFREDVTNTQDGDGTQTCRFSFDGERTELRGRANITVALKAALGLPDDRPNPALAELDAFADFARQHGNASDVYVRFSADGRTLEDAGSRNILRGSGSREENNDVRQRLLDCVNAVFKGDVPQSVRDVMTNFDGNGHPLSARRIGLIWSMVDAELRCKSARAAMSPRLERLADLVRAKGTEAEKANFAGYRDAIVTAKNVRILADRILAAMPNASEAVRRNVLNNLMGFFAEVAMRQALRGRKPDSFETLMARFADTDEQIRNCNFSLSDEQLRSLPGKMKEYLAGEYQRRKNLGHFHNQSNVYVLFLREYRGGSVRINGQLPPEKPTDEQSIVDGDREISVKDLHQGGGTGVSGADGSKERRAFHETLVRQFPDRNVRALISMMLSMADGAKGYYSKMFDLPRPENVNGPIPKYLSYMQHLQQIGVKNTMVNLLDKDPLAKGTYEITTVASGQAGKKDKIRVKMTNVEGMLVYGGAMNALKLENESLGDMVVHLARREYETVFVIDPNEIGENGLPAFTVEEPEMK